jgi:hypothetical protein
MEIGVKYQGRTATTQEIDFINQYIGSHPNFGRTRISRELCKKWNWTYSNGALKEQVCRSYLLALERAGHIELPAKKCSPHNPLAKRGKPDKIEVNETAITGSVDSHRPLSFVQARHTPFEPLYNSLIEHYHYLGYVHPVGEHLKYLAYSQDRVIGCISFSSAPRHIGSRDRFIGWGQQARKRNIRLIAYNTRFLILPWVKIPNLASHILGTISRRVSSDWEPIYKHGIYLLETFVDTELFSGTCYKAANWICVGKTTGRGKNDHTNKANRSIKSVWCYPLVKNFRTLLTK